MQSLTFLLTVLATFALAAPTPKSGLTKRSFFVPRLRNTAYVRDPVKAMSKAYNKYGWSLPTFDQPSPDASRGSWGQGSSTPSDTSSSVSSTTAAAAATTSSASPASTSASANDDESTASKSATDSSATNSAVSGSEIGSTSATLSEGGAEYYSPVTIGGQTLNLDFDTGSADLWVFGSGLSSSELGSHIAFDSSKSSTFKALSGYTFEISYGDGSTASGTVGTDTVSIGDATVTSQAVELATSVSSSFTSDDSSDGLVGLAFSVLNSVEPKEQNTFFANVMSNLDQPVFTADLDVDGNGGYEFGAIDTSKYSGSLTYVDIDNSNGFWQFDSTSYSIGGTTGQNSDASPAIIDTGTSLLLLDDSTVTAYWSQVSSAQSSSSGYYYDCDDTLPDFAAAIGSSYMVKIPGSAMSYSTEGNSCFGGLQSNSGEGIQIFGDFALKEMFVVFDGGNESIGVADKA